MNPRPGPHALILEDTRFRLRGAHPHRLLIATNHNENVVLLVLVDPSWHYPLNLLNKRYGPRTMN
jgi:hypothetical protein